VAAVTAGESGRVGRGALAAVLCGAAYLVVALLPGGGLGFGDVKLAAVLGFALGWIGWPAVLAGLILPHVINGPVALFLLVSGRARRGTALPLGPALLAGALLAVAITA
jgi:leader peptidase (prepilin peptidase)/N-methyltransferase